MNDFTIRPAVAADAATIVAANIALAAETEDKALDADRVARAVQRELADPRLGEYYVAEHAGKVIGQLMFTTEFSDWRDGTFWWIQSVYVFPEARGQGVYRALHRHIEQLARATPGVCGLRLYVERENTTAQTTYERMGMTPTNYLLYETEFEGQGSMM